MFQTVDGLWIHQKGRQLHAAAAAAAAAIPMGQDHPLNKSYGSDAARKLLGSAPFKHEACAVFFTPPFIMA